MRLHSEALMDVNFRRWVGKRCLVHCGQPARFQTGWVLSVREREGPEMIPSNLSSWKQDFSTYPEGKVGGGAGCQ